MTPDQLESWVDRARTVAARLQQLGLSASVSVKYEAGQVSEFSFTHDAFVSVALCEMLCVEFASNQLPDSSNLN
jgi:hypothetical protein